ncbi:MAG: hypothetical protein R3F35_01965 [Myxococcota bacterium]
MDPWILGASTEAKRNDVIHTTHPRFFIETVPDAAGSRKAGAPRWLDDPGPADARCWSTTAAAIDIDSVAKRPTDQEGG